MQSRNAQKKAPDINATLDKLLSENPTKPRENISLQLPPDLKTQQDAYQVMLNNLCDILSIDQATREQNQRENPNAYQLLKKYLAQIYINSQTYREDGTHHLKNHFLVIVKNAPLFQLVLNHLQHYFLFGITEPLQIFHMFEDEQITELTKNIYHNLALFLTQQSDEENKKLQLLTLVTNITDLADQLKLVPNEDHYLNGCKTMLNDVFALIKKNPEDTLKATFCLAISNHFANFIESKIKILDDPNTIHMLNQPNKKSKDSPSETTSDALETSFITQDLAKNTNLSIQMISERRKQARAHLERLDHAINNLQSVVNDYHGPLTGTFETMTNTQNLLKSLKKIKENILHEWCIYLTHNKSETGEFGYVNPYHYFFDSNENDNFIDHDVAFVKKYCYQELEKELRIIAENNLIEIENEKKSLLISPLASWIKSWRFGNQNNDSNSKNKILVSLQQITTVLLQAANKQNYTSGEFHKLATDIIHEYNENLYGASTLGEKLGKLRRFYAKQIEAVYSLFNRHHTMIEFLSSSTNHENKILLHELYHAMSIKSNHQYVQKAEQKCRSRFVRFLEFFSYPNNNFEHGHVQHIFTMLKTFQPLSAKDYLELLQHLSVSIYKLRTTPNSYIDRHRADAIEKLCYDLIETHCLCPIERLPLNFSAEQLTDIKNIVFAINKSDSNKKAIKISQQLIQRIQHLHGSPDNDDRLLLSTTKQTDTSLMTHGAYTAKDTIKLETFKKAFIRTMTSHTIAQYAISSGQLQTMPGVLTQTALLSENTLIPWGGYAYGVAWRTEQKRDQYQSQNIIKNMPPLTQWMVLIEKDLAPTLAHIFHQQIINMKNSVDIEHFAEFCQIRMFAALKQSRQDWAEGLTDEQFLIAAIFKMPSKLTFIPFRTDHYHQQNDSSLFGKSNFQKMVGSVAFIANQSDHHTTKNSLHDPHSTSTTNIYIGLKPIQQSKKVDPTHKSQIKKTVQKYGVVDLSNTNNSLFAHQLASITARTKVLPSDPILCKEFHHTQKALGDFLQEKQAELLYPINASIV